MFFLLGSQNVFTFHLLKSIFLFPILLKISPMKICCENIISADAQASWIQNSGFNLMQLTFVNYD